MKKVCLLLACLVCAACAVLTEVNAPVGVQNNLPYAIQTVIDNQPVGPIIVPDTVARFSTKVRVHSEDSYSSTEAVEKTANVPVTFIIVSTGKVAPIQADCTAGPPGVLNIFLYLDWNGDPTIECDYNASYEVRPVDSLRLGPLKRRKP